MPLTPGESDHEDTTQSSPMVGRKRNAGEMEDDVEKSNTSGVGAGVGVGQGAGVTETIEAEVSPDFTIECPVRTKGPIRPKGPTRPKRKGPKKSSVPDNVHIEKDAPVLAPNLHIKYGVRPGDKWAKLLKFKNAKCKCEPTPVVQPLIRVLCCHSQGSCRGDLLFRADSLRQPPYSRSTVPTRRGNRR